MGRGHWRSCESKIRDGWERPKKEGKVEKNSLYTNVTGSKTLMVLALQYSSDKPL